MQTEERFKLLLTAPPDTLAAVDAALVGKQPELERPNLRLLHMREAASASNLSRCALCEQFPKADCAPSKSAAVLAGYRRPSFAGLWRGDNP